METVRKEIMPGVWLTSVKSSKFKTACMSVTLLTQLDRDTAALNAIIPYVLRRGTSVYPDMESLAMRMDELYGTAIEPVVRRIGEIQCVGFFASLPENRFVPAGDDILRESARLMADMLLNPTTRGGLLLPQYVDSEKEKLLELIRSRINEKRSYSVQRCLEEMCCYEDFAVSRYGDEQSVESIRYQKLSKYYRNLLSTSPVEMFYCGREEAQTVADILRDAFAMMPRGEINYDIGTDIRMNAVEDKPRYVEEELDVTQGKLVIGFRLGECMDDPDLAAIYVFNAVFGGSVTSKLFMNVREKLSLCYYASSMIDTHKGLMLVASGIEFDKFEAARDEILAQLDAVRNGDITDEELSAACACVASDMRTALDSQGDLEGFYLSNAIDGLEIEPQELAELAEQVTREDVVSVANSIECDLIYFLKGGEADGEEDDEDAAEEI